jgi:hypothetical protein
VWAFGLAAGAQEHIEDVAGINIFSASAQRALESLNLDSGKSKSFSLSIGGYHAFRSWSGRRWDAANRATRRSR